MTNMDFGLEYLMHNSVEDTLPWLSEHIKDSAHTLLHLTPYYLFACHVSSSRCFLKVVPPACHAGGTVPGSQIYEVIWCRSNIKWLLTWSTLSRSHFVIGCLTMLSGDSHLQLSTHRTRNSEWTQISSFSFSPSLQVSILKDCVSSR